MRTPSHASTPTPSTVSLTPRPFVYSHGHRAFRCLEARLHDARAVVLTPAAAVDLLLVMTVEPGFGGQKFQEATMAKVACPCVVY